MIRTIPIHSASKAKEKGYSVITLCPSTYEYLVALSPTNEMRHKLEQMQDVSEREFIESIIEPYYQSILSKEGKQALNNLYQRSKTENIALADDGEGDRTFRNLIIGLLQCVGAETEGKNYSVYWLHYRKLYVENI